MSRPLVLERAPSFGRHRDDEPRGALLTEPEAAERCRYFDRGCADPVRSFRQWAKRAGVPVKVIARRRHYDAKVLDAFVDNAGWTKRHRLVKSA